MTRRLDSERLLATYPRRRPDLSPEFEAMHLELLVSSREGAGVTTAVSQRLESWMHKRVAAASRPGAVLEMGAGVLNHLEFESEGLIYDVVEPESIFYQGKPQAARVRDFYADLAHIPEGQRYGRIISIATLEHVTDLPHVVARAGLMLEDGGLFQAGIPSEGGALWALSWRLGRDLPMRLRTGLDYGELMRHEHVSDAKEILAVVRTFFRNVSVSWWPIGHVQLSLYGYLEATDPDLDLCRRWCAPSTR